MSETSKPDLIKTMEGQLHIYTVEYNLLQNLADGKKHNIELLEKAITRVRRGLESE